MFRRVFTTLILTGAVAMAVMMAHDPSQHKGTATKGEVLSIVGSRMDLKTDKGVKTVALDEKTKFERGNAKASLSDFKKGDRVAILGTTLASGEIVAKEVLLDVGAPTAAPKHDQGHKH
jgi:hypothetical protein